MSVPDGLTWAPYGIDNENPIEQEWPSEGKPHSDINAVYQFPFHDHTGNQAIMTWVGKARVPLPPLYNFSIYLTHPQSSPATVRPLRFMATTCYETNWNSRGLSLVRVEFYFLPCTGSEEETVAQCIQHYRAEKTKRNSVMRQIASFRRFRQTGARTAPQFLPGFIPSYAHDMINEYRGIICISRGANWVEDRDPVLIVHFDPIPPADPNARHESWPGRAATKLDPIMIDREYHLNPRMGKMSIGLFFDMIATSAPESDYDDPWLQAIDCNWLTWHK